MQFAFLSIGERRDDANCVLCLRQAEEVLGGGVADLLQRLGRQSRFLHLAKRIKVELLCAVLMEDILPFNLEGC